jgi:L-arabinokinase
VAPLTLERFVEMLRIESLAAAGAPVSISRAPGRLDVMGGIADYSGSLVLQRPIAEATFAAVQRLARGVLEIVSLGRAPFEVPIAHLADHAGSEDPAYKTAPAGSEDLAYERGDRSGAAYDSVRGLFAGETHWASYVAGPLIVLMHERGLRFEGGVRIVVASDVPEGKGVSSSAAVETAVMRALIDAFDLAITARDIALLCQRSENLVSGAPCGVMDQMACVFGEEHALLALLCQPAELQPNVPLPSALALWGIDSGERHAVGGSDYGAVRTGAFMGRRILRAHGALRSDYLASVARDRFDRELARLLPEELSGTAFLEQYGGTGDTVTTVDPSRTYRVRIPTTHPVHEHDRVTTFHRLLTSADDSSGQRMGELMYQSHASYAACGLGSPGTDRIVDLVRREGAAGGLYGGRITGGGSGGTVAVLGRRDAAGAIEQVANAYAAASGYRPQIFSGSSSGVASFGAHRIDL